MGRLKGYGRDGPLVGAWVSGEKMVKEGFVDRNRGVGRRELGIRRDLAGGNESLGRPDVVGRCLR